MSLQKHNLAVMALALFDRSMQDEIIQHVKNTPATLLRQQLNRDAHYDLTPGIFSLAGPAHTGNDPEVGKAVLLGLAVMMADALKKRNVTPDYWADVFESTFGIDEVYARKLGEQVDTVDDANGVGANLRYGYAALSRAPLIGWLLPDADANTIADDVDAAYEIYQAGVVVSDQMKRAMLSTARAGALLRPDLTSQIQTVLEALESVKEGGDIYAADRAEAAISKWAPLPIPPDERGGFFDDVAKFGQKVLQGVGKFVQSDVGKVVAGAASLIPGVGGALSLGLKAAGIAAPSQTAPAPAPAPAQAPSGSSQQVLADVSASTGGAIRVLQT